MDGWSRLSSELLGPRLLEREIADDKGKFSASLNWSGKIVAFQDERGRWENVDGAWTRKGSRGTDFFDGEVVVDPKKSEFISISNSDSGVTRTILRDGSSRAQFHTEAGARYSLTRDAEGIEREITIDSSTWKSSNGKDWVEEGSGQKWSGRVGVDEFGRYWEKSSGGTQVIAESAELSSRLKRQQKLQSDWKIDFVAPGGKITQYGKTYTCRPLRESELNCLETVLYRNQQMNVSGLQFAFIDAGPETDSNTSLWGSYNRTENGGGPRLKIMPLYHESKGWSALEGTLEHELVHHEQHNNWGSSRWGSTSSPRAAKGFASDMGWSYDTASGAQFLADRDGGFWARVEDGWAPVVGNTPILERKISNADMRAQAKVKPCTTYFTSPGEMHAEGMAMFRMSRSQLFAESPTMYELCKKWDQSLIDGRFGTADGKPRFIRDAKGAIIKATEQNLNRVREDEANWRLEMMPPLLQRGNTYIAGASGCCVECNTLGQV